MQLNWKFVQNSVFSVGADTLVRPGTNTDGFHRGAHIGAPLHRRIILFNGISRLFRLACGGILIRRIPRFGIYNLRVMVASGRRHSGDTRPVTDGATV